MTTPERSKLSRERLSRELRRLRTEAKMTGTAVARAVGMSQSKLSKIENGMLLPSVADVERLVAELAATRQTRTELVKLTRRLHAEGDIRRVVLHRGGHRHQQETTRIEANATTSRIFHNAGIPPLLQSENYLQLVLHPAPGHELRTATASLRARRRRMEDPSRQFVFLLAESALRWRPGPAGLMREQIDHLIRTMRRPNVVVGVVPWTVEGSPVALHNFQVYDERVVTLSVLTGNATITDPHDVREYLTLFDRLDQLALHDEQLEDLLRRIADDHHAPG
ncbi:helix-turn-helix transcriptional regulator [Actinosynnema sp. NPDC050436]|uniref:helix-turn-helix domain-containing protein n=1 Tax=Actinosynnema sp. NPDC050436 TaxID=3155659 RepID=UPI0033EAA36C